MIRRKTRIALLALFCCCGIAANASDGFVKITVEGRTIYIVPKEYSEQPNSTVRSQLTGSLTEDQYKKIAFWTPTTADATEAERSVKKFIDDSVENPKLAFPLVFAHPDKFIPNALRLSGNEIGLIKRDYDKYAGQFVGIAYGKDRRIYCSFFFAERTAYFHIDTSNYFLDIYDGGHSVWKVDYDLQSKNCLNLQINGPWESEK